MRIVLVGTLILLSGCTASYQYYTTQKNGSAFSSNYGVCISIPPETKQQAGIRTAVALKKEFIKYTSNVKILENCVGEPCWDLISDREYHYFAYTEILLWQENYTEWSGIPDKIEIRLSVFDTSTKQQLSSVTFHAKSKRFTFGGDHPEDLLEVPIQRYVRSLYLNKKLP